MGSFTNYLELKMLDLIWGKQSYTAPSTIYVGLSTTTIADDGTNISEPSGNNYSRAAVTNDLTQWPAATINGSGQGQKQNGEAIEFPEATGSWGTIVDFFFADAASGGNILAYGTLSTSKTIQDGDIPRFNAQSITITLQ